DENDDEEGERDDDHQALPGLEHVFVFATPHDIVAGGEPNITPGDGFVDGAHGHLHIGADINAFDIHVNPGVGHGGFALDAHGGAYDFDGRELAERDLRAGGSGDNDFTQRAEVLAKVAAVTKVDTVALE